MGPCAKLQAASYLLDWGLQSQLVVLWINTKSGPIYLATQNSILMGYCSAGNGPEGLSQPPNGQSAVEDRHGLFELSGIVLNALGREGERRGCFVLSFPSSGDFFFKYKKAGDGNFDS